MTKIENRGNEKDAAKLTFPGILLREEIGGTTYVHESLGLTKREYFAGLAMQGCALLNQVVASTMTTSRNARYQSPTLF